MCIGINYNSVGSFTKEELGLWKCPNCSLNFQIEESSNVSPVLDTSDDIKCSVSFDTDLNSSLSLASTIGAALLNENEDLK